MSEPTHRGRFGPRDRIAAFAEATEVYAETLDDPDLANVYWGKSLGLWQAVAILTAGGRDLPARALRGPVASCGTRPGRAASSPRPTRPVASETTKALPS